MPFTSDDIKARNQELTAALTSFDTLGQQNQQCQQQLAKATANATEAATAFAAADAMVKTKMREISVMYADILARGQDSAAPASTPTAPAPAPSAAPVVTEAPIPPMPPRPLAQQM